MGNFGLRDSPATGCPKVSCRLTDLVCKMASLASENHGVICSTVAPVTLLSASALPTVTSSNGGTSYSTARDPAATLALMRSSTSSGLWSRAAADDGGGLAIAVVLGSPRSVEGRGCLENASIGSKRTGNVLHCLLSSCDVRTVTGGKAENLSERID